LPKKYLLGSISVFTVFLFLILAMPSPRPASARVYVGEPSPAAPPSIPFSTPKVDNNDSAAGNLSMSAVGIPAGIITQTDPNPSNVSFTWYNATFNQTEVVAYNGNTQGTGAGRSAALKFSWDEYTNFTKISQTTQNGFNYSSRVPLAQLEWVEYNTTLGWGNLAMANSSQYQYFYYPTYSTNYQYFTNLSFDQMNPTWVSNSTNSTVLLKLQYSYSLPINFWQIIQNGTSPIFLPNQTNTFTQVFYETFEINDPTLAPSNLIFNATLSYIPAYTNKVKYISMWAKDVSQTSYGQFTNFYTSIDTRINNITWISNASSDYQIYYSANFTVKFEKVLVFPFAVDRLAQFGNVRERSYFVNVTAGPAGLCIENYFFNDTTLSFLDITDNSTYFGRSLLVFWNNLTLNDQSVNQGVTLVGGYLAPGETDVLSVTYTASASLSIVVTDQTQTPISGAQVQLFWYNMTYGTYLRRDLNLTMAPKLSDSTGDVSYPSVPAYGNYSIVVQYLGNTYGPYNVYTNQSVNLVTTMIPHLPVWVISYASFSAVIFVIGYWRYRKFRGEQ